MEFRQDCKELRGTCRKAKDLKVFKERASYRVDLAFTSKIIMSGNAYQRHLNYKNNTQVVVGDGQATSAIGFIGHLNSKLQEMNIKGSSSIGNSINHSQSLDEKESKQLKKLTSL